MGPPAPSRAPAKSREALERFQVNWNRSQAATAARRPSGAPAQARTLRLAAVSDKESRAVPIEAESP